jgi:NAD(P)-dependent dehydrogenase (short-subunit alcohol dehydrogenase family)
MTETGKLAGKVAVVSGGGGGIGKAICVALAGEGAHVVVGDLDEALGKAAVAAVEAASGQAIYEPLDVTDEASWQSLYNSVRTRFSRLDVVVNNAGIFLNKLIADTSVADWDRIMAVNARGVFLGTRLGAPLMSESGGGSIVNIASASGLTGSPLEGAYTASKGAVRAFTKSAALQYAAADIRVNSLHPATVDTPMPEVIWDAAPGMREKVASSVPMARLARPEEISSVVVFLASDDSSFMTGSEVVVDGGLTAQ